MYALLAGRMVIPEAVATVENKGNPMSGAVHSPTDTDWIPLQSAGVLRGSAPPSNATNKVAL